MPQFFCSPRAGELQKKKRDWVCRCKRRDNAVGTVLAASPSHEKGEAGAIFQVREYWEIANAGQSSAKRKLRAGKKMQPKQCPDYTSRVRFSAFD